MRKQDISYGSRKDNILRQRPKIFEVILVVQRIDIIFLMQPYFTECHFFTFLVVHLIPVVRIFKSRADGRDDSCGVYIMIAQNNMRTVRPDQLQTLMGISCAQVIVVRNTVSGNISQAHHLIHAVLFNIS